MIDTHAHLTFPQFDEDRAAVVLRAAEAGVSSIINIGCDRASSEAACRLTTEYEMCYASVGMHPYSADELTDEVLQEWRELRMKYPKIVAVGECGFDFVKGKVAPDVQREAFLRQLCFAEEMGLPVVIHNRGADKECLEVLSEVEGRGVPYVFHCFSGDLAFAQEIWARGGFTSFTGIVTYPGNEALCEVIREMPIAQCMVETDAPFLAPQGFRATRNEPSYAGEVIKKIAQEKRMSFEEVEEIMDQNSLRFFAGLG